jgi:hypothetical protein
MRGHQQPESQLQRAIVQHYRARATPGTFMFAVPNGGARSKVEAAIMKSTGTVASVPDTIWIRDGKVYGLEIKTDNGRPTKTQLETITAMEAAGTFCCIAYGIDRCLQVLEKWGLLKPQASRAQTGAKGRMG